MLKKGLLGLTAVLVAGEGFSFSAWDRANRPELMDFNYERNFSKLEKYGVLPDTPWSGDYWPTYKGGITYRWNKPVSEDSQRYNYELPNVDQLTAEQIKTLSPAEKYDLFIG